MTKRSTNLIDFNFDSELRTYLQKLFCEIIELAGSKNKLFHEWKYNFTYLHGNLDTQRNLNIISSIDSHGIELKNEIDLYSFIYSLEIIYITIVDEIGKKFIKSKNKEQVVNYYIPSLYILPSSRTILQLRKYIQCSLNNIHDLLLTNGDVLKDLYEKIFDKKIRHSLGAFFTPDWLCEYIVSDLPLEKNIKITDPTCGSGSFLCAVIDKKHFTYLDNNTVFAFGLDINPLSVFTAKTNYLLRINSFGDNFILPIFQCDIAGNELVLSQMNPLIGTYTISVDGISLNIKKDFRIEYSEFCNFYALCIEGDSNAEIHDEFLKVLYTNIIKQNFSPQLLLYLLDKIALHAIPKSDYVVGNPPWVNWEYLPKEYREKTKNVWQYYGLFDYKGLNSIFVKEDISSLVTYISIDMFLKEGGSILFVLKESLLKSTKQAAGFRKFYIQHNNTQLRPIRVDDLTSLRVFDGSASKSIILKIEKGSKAVYPIDVRIWQKRRKFNHKSSLQDVLGSIDFSCTKAAPSSFSSTSGFAYTSGKEYCSGVSAYKARIGVYTGGANALYWFNITKKINQNSVEVKNITERTKVFIPDFTRHIEIDMLYPLVTGRDIGMWRSTYSKYILIPHSATTKMSPISLDEIGINCPLTASYFYEHETYFKSRKGFTSFDRNIFHNNFHAIQRIGEYSFTKYKVCWKYISREFIVCVVSRVEDVFLGNKIVIPNEKISYISMDDEDEAYYVCGILSSHPFKEAIEGRMNSTQISPAIIEDINIKKFDKKNTLHRKISKLCKDGHLNSGDIPNCLAKINLLVSKLYDS